MTGGAYLKGLDFEKTSELGVQSDKIKLEVQKVRKF